MKYKIVITKIEEKTVTKRGEYTIIDERPWTDEELSKEMSSHYGDRSDFLAKNPLKEVRGYAPSRDAVETEEVKMLEQTVESLDLAAVIKAVNSL